MVLGTARPIRAQTAYPLNGTAGFETGLQRIATVDSPFFVTVDWGDGSGSTCFPGVLTISDTCLLSPGGNDLYGTHRYTSSGVYKVSVSYVPLLSILRTTITTTATISPPGDFVILSIGDSIASGEGNPPVPNTAAVNPPWAYWDDPHSDYTVSPYPADELAVWPAQSFPCHRSGLAGPAQAAGKVQLNNPGVTFVHYACSGAKITATDTDNNLVQDAVDQLRVARGRLPRVDLLLISAAANSIHGAFGHGFGDLISHCLLAVNNCATDPQLHADINTSLGEIPAEYAKLAQVINCINPSDGTREPSCTDPQKQIPKLALITEYMDPTHDQNGNFPDIGQCPATAFKLISNAEWMYFHDGVLHPLNQVVDSFPVIAQQAGLTVPAYAVTGIEQDFLTHGVCAGPQRWVLDVHDSQKLLGPGPHPFVDPPNPLKLNKTSGTGHPISSRYISDLGLAAGGACCGQEDYRDRIYAAIVKYNPPITTPSATTNGQPYAFGTWTTHNVTMNLSAVNAISEAGVRATFYALDNAQCSSASAAACLTYAGPFMITTSGKHTVTFFSENALGFPEATQSVQVWVDNTPPAMTCTATPSVLWPPNNRMVPVNLHVTAVSAAFGPTPFSLKSVATSEGNPATDIEGFVIGQPSAAGSLRASRLGTDKAGRVYTLVYQSVDPLGLTRTCAAHVVVPHDQRK